MLVHDDGMLTSVDSDDAGQYLDQLVSRGNRTVAWHNFDSTSGDGGVGWPDDVLYPALQLDVTFKKVCVINVDILSRVITYGSIHQQAVIAVTEARENIWILHATELHELWQITVHVHAPGSQASVHDLVSTIRVDVHDCLQPFLI